MRFLITVAASVAITSWIVSQLVTWTAFASLTRVLARYWFVWHPPISRLRWLLLALLTVLTSLVSITNLVYEIVWFQTSSSSNLQRVSLFVCLTLVLVGLLFVSWRLSFSSLARRLSFDQLPLVDQQPLAEARQWAQAQYAAKALGIRIRGAEVERQRDDVTPLQREHEGLVGLAFRDKAEIRWLWTPMTSVQRRNKHHPWLSGDRVVLPNSTNPVVVVGGTGSGKTSFEFNHATWRLIQGHQVLFIDPKGDGDLGRALCANAAALNKKSASWPEEPLNLFAATADVQVRLIELLLPRSDSTNFYQRRTTNVVQAVLDHFGPASSVEELLKWTHDFDAWADTNQRAELGLTSRKGSNTLFEVAGDLRNALSLLRPIHRNGVRIDGTDWDLLTVAAPSAQSSSSNQVVNAIMYLVDAASKTRPKEERPLTVIVDEASAAFRDADPEVIAQMCEQFRSANIELILAGQSIEAFPGGGERILQSGIPFIVFRTRAGEALATLGGTKPRIERIEQVSSGLSTGMVSQTLQETFNVHPNQFRNALMAEGVLMVSGYGDVRFLAAPPWQIEPRKEGF